jgi:hypothetical protein
VIGRARERLFERGGGKCERCGAVATTFDHIGSACNRPINLRLMCDVCAETREFGDPRVLDAPASAARLDRLARRIAAPVALFESDDADAWDWRAFLSRRSDAVANRRANLQNPADARMG